MAFLLWHSECFLYMFILTCRHSTEAVQYFLDPSRMANPRYTTLLHDILHLQPAAQSLLNALAAAEKQLVSLLSLDLDGASQEGDPQAMQVDGAPPQPQVKEAAPFAAVRLVKLLAKLKPGWLAEHPRIVAALRARWASPGRATRMAAPADLPEAQSREPRRLAKCLLNYVDLSHGDLATLFDILSICQVTVLPSLHSQCNGPSAT
jgi:transformation/transcription domain-associated protein